MTENHAGWKLDELRRKASEAVPTANLNAADRRSPADTVSGFVAINCKSQELFSSVTGTSSSNVVCATANSKTGGTKKHPPVFTRDLGIGTDDVEVSRLDSIAAVNTSTYSLPSKMSACRSKRPAKRLASNPEPITKRAKTDADTISRSSFLNSPTIQIRATDNQSGLQHAVGSSTHATPVVSLAHIAPWAQSTPCWNTHKYQPQSQHLPSVHYADESSHGVTSLIAPVTTFDTFRAVRNHSFVLRSNYPQPKHEIPSLVPPSRASLYLGRAHPKREVLEPISEESPSPVHMKATETTEIRTSDSSLPSRPRPVSRSRIPAGSAAHVKPSQFDFVCRALSLSEDIPEDVEDYLTDTDDVFHDIDQDITDEDLLSIVPTFESVADFHKDAWSKTSQTLQQLPKSQPLDSSLQYDINDLIALSDLEAGDLDLIEDIETSTTITSSDAPLMLSTNIKKPSPEVDSPNLKPQTSKQQASLQQAFSSPLCNLASNMPVPIVRPPFPQPILDRSPLLYVSSTLKLKTCFRLGEALNIAAHFAGRKSSQASDSVLIELYARIMKSYRPVTQHNVKQEFLFADMWSEKGPKLQGEWTGWKGSQLFERDAEELLTDEHAHGSAAEQNKMCRAVGRMKRVSKEWKFVVLSIWECGWEDVLAVKDIICRPL